MRVSFIARAVVAVAAPLLAHVANGQTAAPPAPTTSAASAAADPLPPGPAHDTTVRVCSGCHAPEIAAQQRLSKAGWHELVETMAARGAQGSDEDFAQITEYLAKNFPDQPPAK